jgi:molecular chaperone GrpE
VTTRTEELSRHLLPQADLAGDIEKLQDDLRTERDRHLRTLADFKNYRRRVERDGNKLAGEGIRAMILPLLDIIDDLEKALDWARGEKQPLAEGVQIIHGKLLSLLEAQGVLPFESVGMQFDPRQHEAVAMTSQEGSESGTVVDELRRGYLWNNELLRAAQVRVAE